MGNAHTKVLPPSLIGSFMASSGSILEMAGTGSVGHKGIFQQLLTEANPVAPPLPKPYHINPIYSTPRLSDNMFKKEKIPCVTAIAVERGVRICERNNPADTKVSEGGGRR